MRGIADGVAEGIIITLFIIFLGLIVGPALQKAGVIPEGNCQQMADGSYHCYYEPVK